jgi:sulfite exporter TauE/SafE
MVLAGLSMMGFLPLPRAGEGRGEGTPKTKTKTTLAISPARCFAAGADGARKSGEGGGTAIAGFLNGLMPCALVFSLTLKAATAPSVATGAAWLFVFGLGTVPAMALAGGLAHWLGAQALVWLRRAAGCW